MHSNFEHIPVLRDEIISQLNPAPGKMFIDCTAGLGGHSEALLQEGGTVLCIDKDPHALSHCRKRLAPFGDRVTFHHGDFRRLAAIIGSYPLFSRPNGILLDLGVSSMQLDDAGRGFSYRADAPLDMRMNPADGCSAADIVNTWGEAELARIFFTYGEERFARKIAARIVRHRPIDTTADLRALVLAAMPQSDPHPHPERRVFQALRIAVNDELAAAEEGIQAALACAEIVCVLTFHSLEDRLCKNLFKQAATGCTCPAAFPVCVCGKHATHRVLKSVKPSAEEINHNSRAKSARLRTAVQKTHQ